MSMTLIKAGEVYNDGSGKLQVELTYADLQYLLSTATESVTSFPTREVFELITSMDKTRSAAYEEARRIARHNANRIY